MLRCIGFLFLTIFLFQNCQKSESLYHRKFNRIVFLSNREASDDQQHIFEMNPDGGHPKNLTPELKSINVLSQPQLSPDGKKVLFRSFSDKIRLQLLDTETLQLDTLTDLNYRGDIQCSFSPQGDKIVFVLKINDLNQVHIISLDDTKMHNISDPTREEKDPEFSADGSKIVCLSKHNEFYSFTLMKTDGSDRIDLLDQKEELRFPSFSPDGKYIAYIAYDKNIPGLYIINTDGSNTQTVTKRSVVVSKPQFLPDASKIVFLSRERGRKYMDIAIINPDGTDFKNLTNGLNIFNQLPHITPDGKSIVFQSVKFKNCEIYRVNSDGSNLQNLTNNPNWDQYPSL